MIAAAAVFVAARLQCGLHQLGAGGSGGSLFFAFPTDALDIP
jgi:hypothetical protein